MVVPFGIVPSLEASSPETRLGLRYFRCIGHGWQRTVVAIPPRGKLNGCCRALVVAFIAMVVAGGCRMFVVCGCLQRTVMSGVALQLSVRCGTASKDGTRGIGIMGRLGLQRTAAGCSAWLGFSVRYIIKRRRKRLLWLAGTVAEVMCTSEVGR
jgi:hypothetical protein